MATTSVAIKLKYKEIVIDIRTKGYSEAAHITDARQRYSLQAGLDKQEDINRCIYDAYYLLKSLLRDYNSDSTTGEQNADLPSSISWTDSATLDISLTLPARKRPANITKTLANLCHIYMVDKAMSLYYASTQEQTYSQTHENLAKARASEIIGILYHKNKPTYA